jgi:hypothetical protein
LVQSAAAQRTRVGELALRESSVGVEQFGPFGAKVSPKLRAAWETASYPE